MFDCLKIHSSGLFLTTILLATFFSFPLMVVGQEASGIPVYDVTAEVGVFGDNFVKARKKAVTVAMKEAVKAALEEILGREVYEANYRLLRKTISRAQRYVRGYRFLEANDNSNEMIVEVHLEITLFTEVLRKKLRMLGILTRPGTEGTVVILIKENSFSISREVGFWDHTPFAETVLAEGFMSAGFFVVKRVKLRGLISEETALNAVQGNIETAADIGLKTGADIVVIGNAVSTKISGNSELGLAGVRTNMSLKVVSTENSVIIAAKSDFGTAYGENTLIGEQEAFNKVTEKLSGFLVDSIRKYSNAKPESQLLPPKTPKLPPLPLTDL